MADPEVAPVDELERRRLLAESVRDELRRAGLPAHAAADGPRAGGAEVDVDPGTDSLGGVFVDWNPDPALTKAVVAAAEAGDFESAAARQSSAIHAYMSTAIVGILRAAGLQAEAGRNDLSPDTVYVESPSGTTAMGTA
ncbi:hypothetical protein ACFXHA_14175 [Nocardia sp. NPDC059240]|uniref:hypothetical protein n=1 Tax=Nocardia sp. NPDC059240 TaxID=3346786 RepID=UPI0036C7B130